jgi:replicative DNA helicase
VLYSSLEMAPHALHARTISIAAQLAADYLLKPWMHQHELPAAAEVVDLATSQLNHRICSISSISGLEAAIEATRPALVVLDYLQLVRTPGDFRGSRADFLSEFANGLADLARSYLIPVVALAQEKRRSEGDGGDARAADPLSGIKSSGGIEEAADTVFFLSRGAEDPTDEIGVRVAKARFGGQLHRDIKLFLKGATTTLCQVRGVAEIGVIGSRHFPGHPSPDFG